MSFITCPLCRQPLAPDAPEARSWRCPQGHSFDVAREGYLNLLPVQQKKSRAPGDNEAMVRARRDFLAAGHYAPLRDAVVGMLRPLQAQRLLDLGCGEGWYTAALADASVDTPDEGAADVTGIDITGIDIARDAVRLAAKQYPRIRWLVAGSAALPLADASVDVVTSLFSPLSATEVARVLAPGGHLLLVTPGANHLQELRARLFDEVRPHRPEKFVEELAPHFDLREQREVAFPLALDNVALKNLLTMTPYAWRATAERRATLEQQAAFTARAEFVLMLFAAKKPAGDN